MGEISEKQWKEEINRLRIELADRNAEVKELRAFIGVTD